MLNQEQIRVVEFLKSLAIDTFFNDDMSFECVFEDKKVIEFDFYTYTNNNEDRICLTYFENENDCESQSTYSLSELNESIINKILVNL